MNLRKENQLFQIERGKNCSKILEIVKRSDQKDGCVKKT
jgi:hypothetical protein